MIQQMLGTFNTTLIYTASSIPGSTLTLVGNKKSKRLMCKAVVLNKGGFCPTQGWAGGTTGNVENMTVVGRRATGIWWLEDQDAANCSRVLRAALSLQQRKIQCKMSAVPRLRNPGCSLGEKTNSTEANWFCFSCAPARSKHFAVRTESPG